MANLTVYNPMSQVQPDGTTMPNALAGHQGELITAEMHGQNFNANMRRGLFTFIADRVVVPLWTAGVVANCALWNPPSSNTIAEIVSVNVGQGNATGVVTTLGWYALTGAQAQGSTFTTVGTTQSGRVGETPNSQVRPYSALTYTAGVSSTLVDVIGFWGATSSTQLGMVEKYYNGRLLLPPGTLMAPLCSTAASGVSTTVQVTWAEWPVES